MKGLELSRQFYEAHGREMIRENFSEYESLIAVGMAGEGSDCFGYDDEISRDHDFEAGFCLWIPDALREELEFKLSRAYEKLPKEFNGVKRAPHSFGAENRRGVILTGEFYRRFTGRDGAPESLREWLYVPEYSLACAVNGQVFRDDLGQFTAIREKLLKGYPEDVRLKKLAARVALMAQSGQYNYERCFQHGEPGAAAMAFSEFTQHALSAIFLLNNRYMPYYKWAFRAARTLPKLSAAANEVEWMHMVPFLDKGRRTKTKAVIEAVCQAVAKELNAQGLTDGKWEYLEPHAYAVMDRIKDSGIRSLHIMETGQ